jgi:hypothetical protein
MVGAVVSSDNESMMQKKYLLVSLATAAALLSGCSAGGDDHSLPEHTAVSAEESGTDSNGFINPSTTEPEKSNVSAKNFEEGAVEVVTLPESITSREDFVEVPLGEVAGSLVETEDETIAVYNVYKGPEIREWVEDLAGKGWQKSSIDTLDRPTSYVTYLTKGEDTISLYANNTDETKNTVISFSK